MTCRLIAAVLSAGVAVAAPIPKAPPPPNPKTGTTFQLATAKMNGELIQVISSVTVTEYITVQEAIQQNGQNVVINRAVPRQREVPQTYQMALKGAKATTADGREISEEDLPKKLGDGAAVVQVPVGYDPEWRKLFADDVIFLEQPRAAGGRFGVALPPPPIAAPPIAPPIAIEKK